MTAGSGREMELWQTGLHYLLTMPCVDLGTTRGFYVDPGRTTLRAMGTIWLGGMVPTSA